MRKVNNNLSENHWARKAIVYHIYPRSFKDGDGDGVGDLKGIIEKLNYLNNGTQNSLGIDVIWLSPVYKSPMADFGYDVSDYYDIDPVFGNLETFDKLIFEAHSRGIKVIMDFVPNHTSSQHLWFVESRSSRNNPKREWYIWRDPKPEDSPPNDRQSNFGGPAWTYDETTKQYYFHSFLSEQPDLNWHNKKVRDEMMKVLSFWLNRGVDGFRADAVGDLLKDKDFQDDSKPSHTHQENDTINAFCEVLGGYEEKFLVSETYINIPGLSKLYKACTNGLHAPLNLNFIMLDWNAESYKNFIDEFETSLQPDDIPNYALGNHDNPRVTSRLGEARARAAALLLFTLRGLPFVYYGEELGMTDGNISDDKQLDPRGIRLKNSELSRDGARTPMQWSSQKYAGFSKSKPWLPVTDNYEETNVRSELTDSNSMLNLYRHIIHFRKKSKALLMGSYRPLELQDEKSVFMFMREHEDEKILVAINFSDKDRKASYRNQKARVVCNTHCDKFDQEMDLTEFDLRPHEGYILSL